MSLQTYIKISGISVENAYISINTIQTMKMYKEQDGLILENPITCVYIGGAVNKNSWVAGDRFNLNHLLTFDGELTRAEIYPLLKTQKVDMFELDFTNALDV